MSRTKQSARKAAPKKRAREEGDNGNDIDDNNLRQNSNKKSKLSNPEPAERPRKSKSSRLNEAIAPPESDAPSKTDTSPETDALPEPITSPDPSLLADQFASAVRKHFSDSSSIELEERYLPTKAFCDTTGFNKTRVASNMPDFLEKFSENVKEPLVQSQGRGPHTLVITSSGIRTADVARELRVLNKNGCHVAKLIAKHMKLKDNVEYMKKHPVGIAISTPTRLGDLADTDHALDLESVKRIVVDASYKDQKNRTIFELQELVGPLIKFLNRPEFRARYGNGVQIMVF